MSNQIKCLFKSNRLYSKSIVQYTELNYHQSQNVNQDTLSQINCQCSLIINCGIHELLNLAIGYTESRCTGCTGPLGITHHPPSSPRVS